MTFIMEYVPSYDRKSQIEFIRKKLDNNWSCKLPITFEKFLDPEYLLSEFVIRAREKLRVGSNHYDKWAINHEEKMALVHKGYSRRELDEEPDIFFLELLVETRVYRITAREVLYSEISPGVLVVTYNIRSISFGNELVIKNKALLGFIKEAVFEYVRCSLFDFNRYPIRYVNFQ